MKKQKNTSQHKILLVSIGILLFLISGSGAFLYLYVNNRIVTKTTNNTSISNNSNQKIPTTNDLQSDLNSINSQSSNLDSEINNSSSGLNDQQTNLVY
jgi:hypothetical protein